jgi:hypothetical protein
MRLNPLLYSLVFCSILTAQQAPKRLEDVHSIYVDSFDAGDAAEAIRSKIVAQLGKFHRLEVVESAELADAVLTGSSQITKLPRNTPNVSSKTADRYRADVDVRLVGRDQKNLWTDDPSIAAASHFTLTSTLAERIVKDLVKAISKAAKTK